MNTALGSTFPLANHCVLQLKLQFFPPAAGSPASRGLMFLIVYNYIFFNHGLPFSIRNFYIRAGQVPRKSMRAGTVESLSVADGLRTPRCEHTCANLLYREVNLGRHTLKHARTVTGSGVRNHPHAYREIPLPLRTPRSGTKETQETGGSGV